MNLPTVEEAEEKKSSLRANDLEEEEASELEQHFNGSVTVDEI